MSAGRSIQHAPYFVLHREGVTASDPLPAALTNQARGVHCDGYISAILQVVPTGGANPAVEILSWCDAAGQFIPSHTPATFTAAGANTPWETIIACRSRIIMARLTGVVAGSVDVWIAGSDLDHKR